jgi:hypothetical protein
MSEPGTTGGFGFNGGGLGPNAEGDDRERTSYLTADELQAAQALHKLAPFALCNVSMGLFSIARNAGGLTFRRCHYTYMPGHDECVRDDVLRLVTKLRKKPASKKPAQPRNQCWGLESEKGLFVGIDKAAAPHGLATQELRELREEVARLCRLCTAAHDQILRGVDDKELLALLASSWRQRPGIGK